MEILFLIFMYLLYILPPILTFVLTGDKEEVIVSLMCTSFLLIPGLIHLIFVICEKSKSKNKKQQDCCEDY